VGGRAFVRNWVLVKVAARPPRVMLSVGRTTSNMSIKIGEVEALFRYPVKSMSGEPLEVADLGWHGLDGDRRLAFRRVDDRSGFPSDCFQTPRTDSLYSAAAGARRR
jgi:hypothetical protein